MCGQLGVIFGTKERQPEERSYLKWLFMFLLLLNEKCGPYATGISWLKDNGSHSIFKRPLSATRFIKEKEFIEVISEVDNATTWLAGHTRWPTRGDVNVLANAHPIRAGAILGTHNGTILNADDLFMRFDLPRFAEVDSEVIFRMADATLNEGRIDLIEFKKRLALCRGLISAVMASKLDPKNVIVIKGNKPLEFRYHPEHNVMIYASDPAHLDVVLQSDTGWQEIPTQAMSLMTLDCDSLPKFASQPFRLAGRGRSGFQRFAG
ncbi:glucosamine 6-phosphate synthetase [bacterium]|nr:glucosamine 6-phosphate synthetase [bacterium]